MDKPQDLNTDNKYKVLFVCLGNICRSPAAHGLFQAIVDKNGTGNIFEIDSAGTYSGQENEGSCLKTRL